MKYKIRTRAQGPTCGTQLGYLKDQDGKVVVFTDKDKADSMAAQVQKEMNAGPNHIATFRYWTIEA